jgi:serine protease AprX
MLIMMGLPGMPGEGFAGSPLAVLGPHMNALDASPALRHKAVWGSRHSLACLVLLAFGFPAHALAAGPLTSQTASGLTLTSVRPGRPNSRASIDKLDHETARRRDLNPQDTSSVIVTLVPGAKLPQEFARYARANGKLDIINGHVLDLPNRVIRQLEAHPGIFQVHYNRSVKPENFRTSFTVGSRAIQRGLGLTGAGVGVAVIDSGIATWHDDLTSRSSTSYPYGNQRVAAFVDFVNGQTLPYDDEGHGSHVAGIISGNGYDSRGQMTGVAPGASLVSLKVLDANGQGTIGNIIAALDWVLANQAQYNIRIVNLSVGATITESYWTDPLTLAAKQLVDAGVTVLAAAGNLGKNANGDPQYGGITSPGNAPWVLTVGASSTNGTTDRADDTMASFSSHGPTYLDWSAKPDLVAPGVGTVSLADPLSAFYTSKAQDLLPGIRPTPYLPYISLSGTSMSTPVVSGTVALMLQVNPSLTPNAVKAILQYTAQEYPGYNPLVQGAGFLNTLGAVRLAAFFATAQPGQPYPSQSMWSNHIIWGNHLLQGGVLMPTANAWNVGTNWGAARTVSGDNIVWGTALSDNIVWGTSGVDDNIVWGTSGGDDNIVWGTDCGGADCDNIVWGTVDQDNIVWGTALASDNIVWGTGLADDNIVWGTDVVDNIVWGTSADDNIVWGTNGDDNIVWGTVGDDNIVWGTAGDDNIVWGTNLLDNIVWGTDINDNIVWGTIAGDQVVWSAGAGSVQMLSWQAALSSLTDAEIFEILMSLSGGPLPAPPAPPPATTTPAQAPPAADLATPAPATAALAPATIAPAATTLYPAAAGTLAIADALASVPVAPGPAAASTVAGAGI